MYVAGGNPSTSRPTVFQSTTGGGNWQSVLQTVNNANVATGWSGDGGDRGWSYGEMALGFTVDPLDAARMIITDFGFAHESEDGGMSWRALYVAPDDLNAAKQPIQPRQPYHSSGLENTTSWNLTWTSPTHIIGGFADIRAAVSNDAGASWSFNYTGDTQNAMYRSVVVQRNGQQFVYAATSSVHDMYQSTYLTDARIDGGTGQVLFSTDGGTTWQLMHNFGHVVTWVEADPNNPNRLFAAVAHSTAGGIYVTNDAQDGAASVWTKLANPPRTQGHAFNIRVLNDGTLVVSYSGRRDSSGAFTASSGVFTSNDGGQTWHDVSAPGMLYWTKDIVVDPSDPAQNTWYAAVFSGWGGPPNGLGGLYRTTNRGATWQKISSLDRVNSVTVNPTNANEAYLTTEIDGLWFTANLQSANPTFTAVAGYHFMQPMRVVYNPYNTNEVWVTSFGGGLRVGYSSSPIIAGDFNRDGHVTSADVPAMLTALADLTAYRAAASITPTELLTLGDLNHDGAVTNLDLQSLLGLLASAASNSSVLTANSTLLPKTTVTSSQSAEITTPLSLSRFDDSPLAPSVGRTPGADHPRIRSERRAILQIDRPPTAVDAKIDNAALRFENIGRLRSDPRSRRPVVGPLDDYFENLAELCG